MSSTPVSLQEGIITTNVLARKRYVILYLLMLWLSAIPPFWIVLWLFELETFVGLMLSWWVTIIAPLSFLVIWMVWALSALVVSRVFLSIAILFHKPREGVFARESADKDYRAWSLRGVIRKVGVWPAQSYPLPWLKSLALDILGYRRKGMGTAFFDCWVDPEFLEVGENVTFGIGSCILTSLVSGEYLIIRKTHIGNNVVIGAASVVAPGTIIGDNCILTGISTTIVGQELEPGYIYNGVPCQKDRENTSVVAVTIQGTPTKLLEPTQE